jgi:hypothetical protein
MYRGVVRARQRRLGIEGGLPAEIRQELSAYAGRREKTEGIRQRTPGMP